MRILSFLAVSIATCVGAIDLSMAASHRDDHKIRDELVGTFWTGTVQGRRFQARLLSGNTLEYLTDKGGAGQGRWEIDNRRFEATIGWADGEATLIRAEISGTQMVGTAAYIGGPDTPLVLTAAPRLGATWEIPLPKAQGAKPGPFDGSYDVVVPEIIGQKEPLVRWILTCRSDLCRLSIGNDPTEIYDRIEPVKDNLLAEARQALQYARERKGVAKQEEPGLAPLLDSRADLASCIDLSKRSSRESEAGLLILCKLNGNPWKKPVVILMGTILANCGPAFCRYSLFPMFRR